MALPFYNQGDQDIYESGEHFIPQERFRLGYTAPPSIANAQTTAGITNTQAAAPYIWPPQGGNQGGGGGGGGDDGGNMPIDVMPPMGMSPGALGGKLPGFGNWLKRTTGTLGDFYSKLPTPTNLLKKVFTAGTDKYNDWKTQQEEEEAERQAITRNRINQKIINTGIYKKTYKPLGADRHPDDLTGEDVDQTGGDVQAPTKTVHSGKPTGGHHQGGGGGIGSTASKQGGAPGTKDASSDWRAEGGRIGFNAGGSYKNWLSSKGYDDMMIGMSDQDIIKLFDSVRGTWSKAQGGRIGYRDGLFVDENIEGPDYDENVMMASDDNNTRILENLFEKYLELGFSPQDAEIKAMEEFELMSQGAEPAEGLASLI